VLLIIRTLQEVCLPVERVDYLYDVGSWHCKPWFGWVKNDVVVYIS